MKHNTLRSIAAGALVLTLAATATVAQDDYRVIVSIENLAPAQGTFHTPFWVAFHDGTFDLYDRGAAADLFFPGSRALERLAEDGIIDDLSADFQAAYPLGLDATVASPDGPFAPGVIVNQTYILDASNADQRYFSYASMVLPSNDFFVANGDPLEHVIFDENGNFVAESFLIRGRDALDAGTEINDELPANTAFFGQELPDTGVVENGVVTGFPDHDGFLPAGSGGILDDALFQEATFTEGGYGIAKFTFRAAPAIVDDRVYRAQATGDNEVPPVATPALGRSQFELVDEGTLLTYRLQFRNLENPVGMHLHLGAEGENGPVVALLAEPREPGGGPLGSLTGEISTASLTGPLLSQPLDALIAEIEAGNVYLNIHTDDGVDPQNSGPGDIATGEIRGQLARVGN